MALEFDVSFIDCNDNTNACGGGSQKISGSTKLSVEAFDCTGTGDTKNPRSGATVLYWIVPCGDVAVGGAGTAVPEVGSTAVYQVTFPPLDAYQPGEYKLVITAEESGDSNRLEMKVRI